MSGIPWNHWPQYQGPLPRRPEGLLFVRSHGAARCLVCERPYERKGRWGICLNKPERHQFDIHTLLPKRAAGGKKRRNRA